MSIKGRVVFYNSAKGFGFIQYSTDDGPKEIYTHYSKLIGCKTLSIGQWVRFTVGENERGQIAESVELIFRR